jgi:hypothetical protein
MIKLQAIIDRKLRRRWINKTIASHTEWMQPDNQRFDVLNAGRKRDRAAPHRTKSPRGETKRWRRLVGRDDVVRRRECLAQARSPSLPVACFLTKA